jgi:hypothetical protein
LKTFVDVDGANQRWENHGRTSSSHESYLPIQRNPRADLR